MNRIWLAVPYAARKEASAAGAHWDEVRKTWYADEQTDLTALAAYQVTPDHAFPGEDRTYQQSQGLFVDMIPSTSWFTNVRSHVSKRDWDDLRKVVFGRADYSCEVCHAELDPTAKGWGKRGPGIQAKTDRLDAHERWSYDENTGTQKLERLICLCRQCHSCTHFGFATSVLGLTEQVKRHMKAVNGFTETEYQSHVREASDLWIRRSNMDWLVDIGVVVRAGYQMSPKTERSR